MCYTYNKKWDSKNSFKRLSNEIDDFKEKSWAFKN